MPVLLHTSDWCLGTEGPGGAARRVEAVKRLAGIAHARHADVVVVAGNVFADLDVGEATLASALDALDAFAPIPVVLVPGERDPAEAYGVWSRLAPRAPEHVHLATTPEPLALGGLHLVPAPRPRRASVLDVAGEAPIPTGPEPVVVVAHGGVRGGLEADQAGHRIDVAARVAAGAAWVALGGRAQPWHGVHAAFPGTPEPMAPEQQGQALLVTLAPHMDPQVETVVPAATRCVVHAATMVASEGPTTLSAWLQALDTPEETVAWLSIGGTLDAQELPALHAVLEDARARLLSLHVTDTVTPTPGSEPTDPAPLLARALSADLDPQVARWLLDLGQGGAS